MSEMIEWIAAEAERPEVGAGGFPFGRKKRYELDRPQDGPATEKLPAQQLPAHQFPGHGAEETSDGNPIPSTELEERSAQYERQQALEAQREQERVRRTYRGRTVGMLRRYFRYAMECGRLPSILGSEFFRAKVTAYTVYTFEDRVIFVHDMEACLERLDEFSRQLIGRHILQEYDQVATSRLLHCSERTVRAYVPVALDLLSDILVEVGLLERVESIRENSCQGGLKSDFPVSDCEDDKYKF